MKKYLLGTLCILMLAILFAGIFVPKVEDASAEDQVTATVYFDGDSALDLDISEDEVRLNRKSALASIEAVSGVSVLSDSAYLLNSVTIKIDESKISDVLSIDGVKGVFVDKDVELQAYTVDYQQLINLYNAEEMGYDGEGTVIAVIDSGVNYEHKDFNELTAPESAKLNENSVETLLPYLNGSGEYYNSKFPFICNYANPTDDPKAIIFENSHGSHVAGIVGANGDETEAETYEAVRGIAPEAQILAMTVFLDHPTYDAAFNVFIYQAIEDAIRLNADVINMSLGSSQFYVQNSLLESAIAAAREYGIVVVVSAGNEGNPTSKSYYLGNDDVLGITDTSNIGYPSLLSDSFSVASAQAQTYVSDALKLSLSAPGQNPDIYAIASNAGSDALVTSVLGGVEIINVGGGRTGYGDYGYGDPDNDFRQDPDEYDQGLDDYYGLDVSGKIVLIKVDYTLCSIRRVANRAFSKGVAAVIITYNIDDVNISFTSLFDGLTYYVPQNYFELALSAVNGGTTTFTSQTEGTFVLNASGKTMSGFSSWGPNVYLDFKPNITAPGGLIYSTANTDLYTGEDAYETMSGTSMSAPVISGSSALIKQSINEKQLNISGKNINNYITSVLMNTATILREDYTDTSYLVSPRSQGAGLLNLENALKTNVTATNNGVGSVSLYEFNSEVTFSVTLTNYSDENKVYNVTNTRVLSEFTVSGKTYDDLYEYALLNADKNIVTVPANSTATVTFTLTLLLGADEGRFLEGWVIFDSTDSEPTLSVPFMGYYGDMTSEDIFVEPFTSIDGLSDDFYPTTLVGVVNGEVQDLAYNSDGVVYFSPNDDENLDEIRIDVGILRNVTDFGCYITDENGNILVHQFYMDYVQRFSEYIVAETRIGVSVFDGKYYDSATDDYVYLPEGKYFAVVEGKAVGSDEVKSVKIPFYIDDTSPTLDNYTVTQDPSDTSKIRIDIEASDNYGSVKSGISPEYSFAIGHDGEEIEILTDEENNMYILLDNTDNKAIGTNILIAVKDWAYNTEYTNVIVAFDNTADAFFQPATTEIFNGYSLFYFRYTGEFAYKYNVYFNSAVTEILLTNRDTQEQAIISSYYQMFGYCNIIDIGGGRFRGETTLVLNNGTNVFDVEYMESGVKKTDTFTITVDSVAPSLGLYNVNSETVMEDDTITIKGYTTGASELKTIDSEGNYLTIATFDANGVATPTEAFASMYLGTYPTDTGYFNQVSTDSGYFTLTLPLKPYSGNYIYLLAFDENGNANFQWRYVIDFPADNEKAISVSAPAYGFVNFEEEYTISGSVIGSYDRITVNGMNATLSGYNFTATLSAENYNYVTSVPVKIYKNDMLIMSFPVIVFVQREAPTLAIKNDNFVNNTLYVDNYSFDLDVEVSGASVGYELQILDYYYVSDNSEFYIDTNRLGGEHIIPLNLTSDNATLVLAVMDAFSNITAVEFNVSVDMDNPEINGANINYGADFASLQLSVTESNLMYIEMSLDNQFYFKTVNDIALTKGGDYYFKAIDSMGRESGVYTLNFVSPYEALSAATDRLSSDDKATYETAKNNLINLINSGASEAEIERAINTLNVLYSGLVETDGTGLGNQGLSFEQIGIIIGSIAGAMIIAVIIVSVVIAKKRKKLLRAPDKEKEEPFKGYPNLAPKEDPFEKIEDDTEKNDKDNI